MAMDSDQKKAVDQRPANPAAASAEPAYWGSFPFFEKLLSVEHPPALAQVETTCRQLDAILKSGSPQEKARAQSAMTAYARTVELYRRLAARRDEAMLAARNMKTASRDK